MSYFVYLIGNDKRGKITTYVGYTNNLKRRLNLHNSSKGAKFTRGSKWKIVYKEVYKSKSEALKAEHKLKKNYLLRKKIKQKHLNG